jgi:hypothetical protein
MATRKSKASRRKQLPAAEPSVLGWLQQHIKAVISMLGFGGLITIGGWIFGMQKDFDGSYRQLEGRITDSGSTAEQRIDAINNLIALPNRFRAGQTRQVARLLQTTLREQTRFAQNSAAATTPQCTDSAFLATTPAPARHISAALAGLAATNKKLRSRRKADFDSLAALDFRGVVLPGVDLTGAMLAGSCFNGADLRGAILSNTNLVGATLDHAKLGNVTLNDAVARNASIRDVGFNEAVVRGTSFAGSDLTGSSFVDADLSGSTFGDAVLTRADFTRAELSRAYFKGAVLDSVRNWSEVKSLCAALLADAEGLTPAEIAFAVERGAIVQNLTERQWQDRKRQVQQAGTRATANGKEATC